MIKALRRLWRLATCTHRNAASWVLPVPDLEVPGEVCELLFCRACGRLLSAARHSDQPQHNTHWLEVDHLDAPGERHRWLPHDPKLRDLATRNDGKEKAT